MQGLKFIVLLLGRTNLPKTPNQNGTPYYKQVPPDDDEVPVAIRHVLPDSNVGNFNYGYIYNIQLFDLKSFSPPFEIFYSQNEM